MSRLTRKYFALIHQKMMESRDYRKGYEDGCSKRRHFERLSAEDLRELRYQFIAAHSPYHAGMAYAVLEVLWDKLGEKEGAA